MLKSTSSNFILIFLSIIVSSIIIEITLQIFFDRYDGANRLVFVGESTSRPPLGVPGVWMHRSKQGEFEVTVRFNSLGFRDNKLISPISTPALIAMGDSFVMGFGVEEDQRFSSKLELDLKVPIYNIAIPGDAVSYTKSLSYSLANGARPIGLIVGVDMENDIQNLGPPKKYSISPTLPFDTQMPDYNLSFGSLKSWLNRHSSLYGLITQGIRSQPFLAMMAKKIGLIGVDVGSLIPTKRSIKTIEMAIGTFAAIKPNIPRLFVIIPSRKLWIGEEQAEARKTHDLTIDMLSKKGLNFLDLKPVFENENNPMKYIYPRDGHWNAEGHLLAATYILEYLTRNDIFSSGVTR